MNSQSDSHAARDISPPAVIVTCHPASSALACRELGDTASQPRLLAPGLMLCRPLLPFAEICWAAKHGRMVFIRGLNPVHRECRLEDLLHTLAGWTPSLSSIVTGRTLALHIRAHHAVVDSKSLDAEFSRWSSSHGITLVRKNPDCILSAIIVGDTAYCGICEATDTLSTWPGGAVRLRREPDQISRSEFKLLEALEVFGVTLPSRGQALDLGAAPGGWSRIMAERGLSVTAVDPAALDSRLRKVRAIVHERMSAQEFLGRHRQPRFDVLLNDMRMHPRDSALLMVQARRLLAPRALAILTLKLPANAGDDSLFGLLAEVRRILEGAFSLLAMRQLFHNRHEVTVLLESKK